MERRAPRRQRLAEVVAWPLTARARGRRARAASRLPLDAGRGRRRSTRASRRTKSWSRYSGRSTTDVLICGHTHMQYDRTLSSGLRVVNPGQRRHAVRGDAWRVLGAARASTSSSGGVSTTSRRCVAAIEVLGAPVDEQAGRAISSNRPIRTRRPPTSSRCVPRSYVREARRRGLGRRRERIVPIIDRLAEEHFGRGDRASLPQRPRAARLRDALGADDRRERQQGHAGALREVPAARGLPRRPDRGAPAGHLRHGVLPAEGEGDPRHDGDAASRSSTARCRGGSRTSSACRASRARPRTSCRRSSDTRRGSWSTRTSGVSRSGSA